MRKLSLFLICGSLVASLSSCWKQTEPKKFVRPVKLAEVVSLNTYDKDFVGVVSAEQYTNYAFRVGGLIIKTYVTEGAYVKQGELMAELDPSDFNLQVEADKAQLVTTKSILDRMSRLLEKQAISKQDYEVAESNYLKAKSAYEYTLNQREYTKLRAPFSGSIEKKYAETYQKVQPGESIYKIINPNLLEVKFTLPESDVNILNRDNTIRYKVEFDNLRGQYFDAELKDAVDASVDGAGIPVTLAIKDKRFNPSKDNVKVGFACKVKVIIDNKSFIRQFVSVPLTAVFSQDDKPGKYFVWVYNENKREVNIREITNSGLQGNDYVIVGSGIEVGDKVVVAGVYQLVDGQRVNILK